MAGAFRPRSIIVTGGCGFTGSNFGHYTAESPNDNSIAGPGPFLRINGGGRVPPARGRSQVWQSRCSDRSQPAQLPTLLIRLVIHT